ncbi:MAG: hypothetical protein ACM3X9_11550 [Bacillota bacterium]
MIFLVGFLILITASLTALFTGNIHGYPGAVILGLDAVFSDLFWQWLRFKIVRKNKTGYLVGGILGGLIVRVASIFGFIQIGLWWLGKTSSYFIVFAALLLTIPIWSIIAAYKFKLERD